MCQRVNVIRVLLNRAIGLICEFSIVNLTESGTSILLLKKIVAIVRSDDGFNVNTMQVMRVLFNVGGYLH